MIPETVFSKQVEVLMRNEGLDQFEAIRKVTETMPGLGQHRTPAPEARQAAPPSRDPAAALRLAKDVGVEPAALLDGVTQFDSFTDITIFEDVEGEVPEKCEGDEPLRVEGPGNEGPRKEKRRTLNHKEASARLTRIEHTLDMHEAEVAGLLQDAGL